MKDYVISIEMPYSIEFVVLLISIGIHATRAEFGSVSYTNLFISGSTLKGLNATFKE